MDCLQIIYLYRPTIHIRDPSYYGHAFVLKNSAEAYYCLMPVMFPCLWRLHKSLKSKLLSYSSLMIIYDIFQFNVSTQIRRNHDCLSV